MKMDDGTLLLITLFIVTIAIVIIDGTLIGSLKESNEELGQAICEQEYDMDYDKYEDGVLSCKPRPKVKAYDGIKIKTGE